MQRPNIYEQKIQEKRNELDRLVEFRDLSTILAHQLEEIGEKLQTMNTGAEKVALLLNNWQSVLKSVSLASLGLMTFSKGDYERSVPLPESLVRIRLNQDESDVEDELRSDVDIDKVDAMSENSNVLS